MQNEKQNREQVKSTSIELSSNSNNEFIRRLELLKGEKNNRQEELSAEKYNEFMTILEFCNPLSAAKTFPAIIKTEDAIQTKTPNIGTIIAKYGRDKASAFIKLWIVDLNESLNIKRTLKEHQIDECAELILSEHKLITIADIHLVFRRLKTGYYGELYESLSPPKILKAFRKYFHSRCMIAANINNAKHKQIIEGIKYADEKAGSLRNSEAKKIESEKVKTELAERFRENQIKNEEKFANEK